jgi:hypothetical protein
MGHGHGPWPWPWPLPRVTGTKSGDMELVGPWAHGPMGPTGRWATNSKLGGVELVGSRAQQVSARPAPNLVARSSWARGFAPLKVKSCPLDRLVKSPLEVP